MNLNDWLELQIKQIIEYFKLGEENESTRTDRETE